MHGDRTKSYLDDALERSEAILAQVSLLRPVAGSAGVNRA
jgi:hypothetical protein